MAYGSTLRAILGAGGGEEILFAATTYTGNGSSLDVDTGQNLAAGGLVWAKRTNGAQAHFISDTARGTGEYLSSNSTSLAATGETGTPAAYLSNGVRYVNSSANINTYDYILFSWLEREGYFDAVTYTATGVNGLKVPHSLGVVPAFCIFKSRTGPTTEWGVWHKDLPSLSAYTYGSLGLSNTSAIAPDLFSAAPDDTDVTLNTSGSVNNNPGDTYIAYLFAEKAGFSKAGSYTGTGSSGSTLISGMGFTPSAILVKRTDNTGDWYIIYKDGAAAKYVVPNTTGQAFTASSDVNSVFGDGTFTSVGGLANTSGGTYIYMAWK